MKSIKLIVIICIGLVIAACSKASKKETLFEEHGTNWEAKGDANWSFTNNELLGVADSSMGFVVSTKVYKNFELNLEFFPDNTVNSGVFVRCNGDAITAADCYEINIWDLHPNQDNRTGAIVTRLKPFEKVETLNQWNTYKIECNGNRIKAWVNDVLTAELADDQLIEGKIALQAFGTGKIKFRNVSISPLQDY